MGYGKLAFQISEYKFSGNPNVVRVLKICAYFWIILEGYSILDPEGRGGMETKNTTVGVGSTHTHKKKHGKKMDFVGIAIMWINSWIQQISF